MAAVEHERPFPTIKHVGEASKTHYLRQAVRDGYDDAAFVDARGHISEATIWNLVFWDGDAVVWPRGAFLAGVTKSIVRRQLAGLNIPQREEAISLGRLSEMKGAAVMNSWTPGVPVIGIASTPISSSSVFMDILRRAYEREPWARV